MQYLINKYEVEFMPDKDNPDDFYRVVLESASGNSKGTGYKLEEQYGRGLVGYFETGILKFRVIEG
jgi:protein involved in sex pheromone biosynthesis